LLYFWVGEWVDDHHCFYFFSNKTVDVGADWGQTILNLTTNQKDWGTLSQSNTTKIARDLFGEPQQYGFVVIGSSSSPSGTVGFDKFEAIPEPSALLLAVFASLGTLFLARRFSDR